jgi:hypothetical protein
MISGLIIACDQHITFLDIDEHAVIKGKPLIGYDNQRRHVLEIVLYFMITSRIITAAADYKTQIEYFFCFVLQVRILQVMKRTVSTAIFLGLVSAVLIVVYSLYIYGDIQISNVVSFSAVSSIFICHLSYCDITCVFTVFFILL